MQPPLALRTRLMSPAGLGALVVTQLLTATAYLAYGLYSGPSDSVLIANLEIGSFLVMPFVWLVLFLLGRWLSHQPLRREHAIAVKVGLVVTGICGVVAFAVAALMVTSAVVIHTIL